MPSIEKAFKSSLTGTVDSFLENKTLNGANEGDAQFLSILDFIDRFHLLPCGLFPVQKFILKLYYNMPLSNVLPEDERERIKITDKFGREVLYIMTEVEYLRYLYDCGRCNIREQDGKERRELVLVLGRRSGKSLSASIIAAYEIYKLLCRKNPQAYYGIPSGSEIRILDVANDREQASIVFGDINGYVNQVDYFKSAKCGDTQTFLKFRTDNDKKTYKNSNKATIVATFKSSVAKGLRGRGVMCVILDELAFFIDDGKCLNINTLVNTSLGLVTLDELLTLNNVDRSVNGWTPINLDVVKESGVVAKATGIYYNGIQKVLNIRTIKGYEIEPTPEHRLRVMSEDGSIDWKYVKDIRIGDYVGISKFGFVNEYMLCYLRELFEIKGKVGNRGLLSFCTDNKFFASKVQLMLLGLGIISSLSRDTKGISSKRGYRVRISDPVSLSILSDTTGFTMENKKYLSVDNLDYKINRYLMVPNQKNKLNKLVNLINKSPIYLASPSIRRKMVSVLAVSLNGSRGNCVSYNTLKTLVEIARDLALDSGLISHFEKIIKANYLWDKVVSISESTAEVADLRVPDGEQYTAGGMVNHNSSAERVYKAIVPSIAQFSPKDPTNRHKSLGPSEGRVISISSPDAREGFFYRLYELSMSKGPQSSNMLMIQAPTWEVNPTLDSSYYEVEYHKDPKSFATEHGAEFSDRVRGWIEDPNDLISCIVPEQRPMARGVPREMYWAGVDFGIVNDGTSIALTRISGGKIELVYHEVWYARKKWKESNPHLESPVVDYALRLQDVPRLDIDEIAEWFKALATRFYIVKGVFDQYAGPIFEQSLHKRGLTQFESRSFFSSESSMAFQNAKMLMYSHKLALYDYPVPEQPVLAMETKRHSPLIQELLELQATSGGKNIINVEAPQVAGKHDDMSDSFVRSLMLVNEFTKDHPEALERKGHMPTPVRNTSYSGIRQMQRRRERMHGGPPKERTVKKLFHR
jgi:intein/homing endonuclease